MFRAKVRLKQLNLGTTMVPQAMHELYGKLFFRKYNKMFIFSRSAKTRFHVSFHKKAYLFKKPLKK